MVLRFRITFRNVESARAAAMIARSQAYTAAALACEAARHGHTARMQRWTEAAIEAARKANAIDTERAA